MTYMDLINRLGEKWKMLH